MIFFNSLCKKKNKKKLKTHKKANNFYQTHSLKLLMSKRLLLTYTHALYCTSTDLLAQCDDDVIVDKNSLFFFFFLVVCFFFFVFWFCKTTTPPHTEYIFYKNIKCVVKRNLVCTYVYGPNRLLFVWYKTVWIFFFVTSFCKI